MHTETLEPLDLGDWALALWALGALVLAGVRLIRSDRREAR
jgi:hypothetical protein